MRAQRYRAEQRSAQDYTFEALHRVYFYDAWRVQPVLDAPGSELVLPPQPGLLVHGCYWPQPSATPDVLSVSDRDTEKEEHEVQEGQPLSSPAATDATMADEEANEAVSVHSSSSESPTIPSTEQPEDDDAHMEDDDSANTSSADEDDCLSNRPAPPEACPAQDEMLEAEDEARSMLPPQDGEPPSSSPTSHFSESPIKRRPGATARHPAADLPAEEDSASDATGSAERSPRLALPVPVGLAEPPEADTEEATEDEDMAAEPNYAFAKGYGRFGIGYTRLATALGNFEQGNIQAESTVVAQWLTSGLRVAMFRGEGGICCLPATG